MFHVKHAAGQSNGSDKRKTTLVIGILAIIAVLLGIVLVVTQPSGETTNTTSSTATVTTQTTTHEAPSEASGNTMDSGITSKDTQDVESEDDTEEEDQSLTSKVDFSGYEYEPDTVLATPVEGVSPEEIAAVLGVEPSQVEQTNAGFFEITLPEGMTVEEAVETLQASESIESAQPDFIYELQDDTEYGEEEFPQALQEEGEGEVEEETIPPSNEAPVSTTQEEASEAQEAEAEDISSSEEELSPEETSESAAVEPESELESDSTSTSSDEVAADIQEESESTSSSTEEADEPSKPNDPRASEQWALESIHAFDAWELLKKQPAQRVSVAIIDEGFELTHQDLTSNLVATGPDSYAVFNAVDGSANVSEVSGANYHGTHVAGIIAAEADNGVGVAGVSYNQAIVPIKVFYLNSEGLPRTRTSYVADAYAYIMKHRAEYNIRVVNISFGIFGRGYGPDVALEKAITEAHDAGIVTVASAGNAEPTRPTPTDNYPSDYNQVVAVINLCTTPPSPDNPNGVEMYNTSNYNRSFEDGTFETCKNIAAPGTDILSTYSNSGYSNKTGTSMAAPCVSGVLAMMFAARPELSADDAVATLYATATDLGAEGFDAETGYGEVNAAAALNAVMNATPPAPEDPESSSSSSSETPPEAAINEDVGEPDEPEPSSSSSSETLPEAEWSAGATKMPVGSTSEWKLKNCSLKVVSGAGVVSVAKDGNTVKAKKTGEAKLVVVDSTGKQVASKTVRVYKLTGKHAVCNIGKGKAQLSVSKNSKKTGAKVVLTKNAKATSAKVRVLYKNGYYQFIFNHTGKPLKIQASSKNQYAPAIQALSLEKKATKWKVTVDSKNRLTFVNCNSGKVLAAKGKAVVQRESTDTTVEKWLVK